MYLKTILKYCEDISNIQHSFGSEYSIFVNNKGYQYAVSFCIEQIGEMAKKLRDEGYAKKYPDIEWDAIAGLRNRIAHAYDSIDLNMVYDIAVDDLPILAEKIGVVLHLESISSEKT